jgi:hypothetical protein
MLAPDYSRRAALIEALIASQEAFAVERAGRREIVAITLDLTPLRQCISASPP